MHPEVLAVPTFSATPAGARPPTTPATDSTVTTTVTGGPPVPAAPAPASEPSSTAVGRVARGVAIMPAFNEERTIGPVLDSIHQHAPGFDIVVVDDGSRDKTYDVARAHGAIVLRHPFNMGYGAALQTAYKYAASRGYDVLVQLDADGQHDPAYVPILARRITEGHADAVVGSRFLLGNGYVPPFARRVGMVLFGYIASVVTRRRVTDPTSGYQSMSRRVFGFLQTDVFPADYPDADVLILLHRAGFNVEEQPVAMRQSPTGKSMHSGVLRPMFYVFKMLLSIMVTLMREPPPAPPK